MTLSVGEILLCNIKINPLWQFFHMVQFTFSAFHKMKFKFFFVEFLRLAIQEVKIDSNGVSPKPLKTKLSNQIRESDQRIQNNPLNQTIAFMKLLFGPGYGSRHVKRPLSPTANVILSYPQHCRGVATIFPEVRRVLQINPNLSS